MGAPTVPAGSPSSGVPSGYPPTQQYSPPQYPPQYPPPQYPQQYEQAQQQQYQPQQQYSQQYPQEPAQTKGQPGYVQQQAVPAVGVPAGQAPVTYASTLQPQPTPGMPTRGPRGAPGPGDVLLGYEICQPETGCCKCDGLSFAGVLAVVLLLFFFFPLACIPCCMPECYEPYQRPVYGRRP